MTMTNDHHSTKNMTITSSKTITIISTKKMTIMDYDQMGKVTVQLLRNKVT
jgi:hypothetical protein